MNRISARPILQEWPDGPPASVLKRAIGSSCTPPSRTCASPEVSQENDATLVICSKAMHRAVNLARIYHDEPSVPVLIEGETGTGKELLARLIHSGGERSTAPFVDVNCAAISPELFEAELFGYEGGAFTGSLQRGARGKLQLAGSGTLLLDEIGELPIQLQPKLLRVLQERCFYPVGSTRKLPFLARVVCCTNRSLRVMVRAGAFRRDLYHRLAVGHLVLPPLRDRLDEIEPLAELFLLREAQRKHRGFCRIDPRALQALRAYNWPGNVRELENVIERAVVTHDGEVLLAEHLSIDSEPQAYVPRTSSPPQLITSLPDGGLNLDWVIDTLVRAVLQKFQGNKSQAARYLGVSRDLLRRRLQHAPPLVPAHSERPSPQQPAEMRRALALGWLVSATQLDISLSNGDPKVAEKKR